MPILHVRLTGSQTQVNLPPSLQKFNIKLKGYRILFNVNNHGYYHASLGCTLFQHNVMSFTSNGQANNYTMELPLFIDPEAKDTFFQAIDYDIGTVQNTNSVLTFQLALKNCISRSRCDLALSSTASLIATSLASSTQTQINGYINGASAYLVPQATQSNELPYTSTARFDANGNLIAGSSVAPGTVSFGGTATFATTITITGTNTTFSSTTAGLTAGGQIYITALQQNFTVVSITDNTHAVLAWPTGMQDLPNIPAFTNSAYLVSGNYPSAYKWVHTGVALQGLDPQPGNNNYDQTVNSPNEQNQVSNSSNQLYGSGVTKGFSPYAYSVDLVFEIKQY